MTTSIASQVIIVIISVIFGGLFSFFITTLTQRKVFRSIAEELTHYHEAIHHKTPVKDQIREHQKDCSAAKNIEKLKIGMVYLVTKSGGSPTELGLD